MTVQLRASSFWLDLRSCWLGSRSRSCFKLRRGLECSRTPAGSTASLDLLQRRSGHQVLRPLDSAGPVHAANPTVSIKRKTYLPLRRGMNRPPGGLPKRSAAALSCAAREELASRLSDVLFMQQISGKRTTGHYKCPFSLCHCLCSGILPSLGPVVATFRGATSC
jgi:hypothetical protein